MITKEARAEAQSRGAHKVLAFYGLDKVAVAGAAAKAAPGILNTLSRAGSAAVRRGSKAVATGKGSTGQNLWAGAQQAGKAFHRMGGTGAAAKAVGVGAAGLGAAYGAGRVFGAGSNAGQKQAGAEEEAQGLANSTLASMLPVAGPAALGAVRGQRHKDPVSGGLRGAAGSLAGGTAGAAGGAALGAYLSGKMVAPRTRNKAVAERLARTIGRGLLQTTAAGAGGVVGGLAGSGLGTHLLTRKYLQEEDPQAALLAYAGQGE